MGQNIRAKIKVYKVYYMKNEELGIYPVSSDERVTLTQGEQILIDNKIDYDEILKVMVSYERIEIPTKDFDKFIIEQN